MEKRVGTKQEAKQTNEQRKPSRKKTTLAELGRQLPIGVKAPDGGLIRAFDYHPMKTKDERAIGKCRKAKMPQGVHMSHVLAQMCDRIGPHEFDDRMKTEERVVRIGQMFMGDVFYAYVSLRVAVMGPELKMNVKCGSCGKEFKFDADLNTTEVVTVENEEDLRWKYDLRDPIKIRGKTVKTFTICTPRWFSISQLQEDDEQIMKIATVRSSIVGINEEKEDVMLTDPEIDELSKFDLEGIACRLDDNFVGPDMTIEGACPRCGASFSRPINWMYDDFFASSSR